MVLCAVKHNVLIGISLPGTDQLRNSRKFNQKIINIIGLSGTAQLRESRKLTKDELT